jgi:hypothetical protein
LKIAGSATMDENDSQKAVRRLIPKDFLRRYGKNAAFFTEKP